MERLTSQSASESAPNALHSEHLRADISPIIACFTENTAEVYDRYLDHKQDTTYVDYEVAKDSTKVEGVTKLKDFYAIGCISEVSETNKFSDGFYNCVGLVATGKLKNSDQNVSFMLHVQPDYFSRPRSSLEVELKARLQKIKQQCEGGTLDAVLFAGTTTEVDGDGSAYASLEYYIDAIKQLGLAVQDAYNFEPVVINPKGFYRTGTVAFFDTNERRLYIGQPSIESEENQSQFLPSQVRDFTPKYERNPFLDIKLPKMKPWED